MSEQDTSAVTGRPVVTLKRARRATDLWTSIETAEFAYVILGGEPTRGGEDAALRGFRATFGSVAEQWNRAGNDNKAPLLAALQAMIDRLRDDGVHVYWACVICSLTRPRASELSLPLALLRLDAVNVDEIEITLREPLFAEIPEEGRDEDADDDPDDD